MPKLAKASDGKLKGLTFPRLAASCPGIIICPVKSGQVPQDGGKMKKYKKAASILFSMVIILGLMPMSVFADPEGGNPPAAPTNADQIGKYYEVDDATGELPDIAALDAGSTQQSYANGQVLVNKTVSPTGTENLFDINLEVITKNKIKQSALSPDAAVVLVIDTSNSMVENRMENAKTAAQTFINSFAAGEENVQRKVAIVKFSGQKDGGVDGATTVQTWTDASALKRDGNARCEVIRNLEVDGGTNIAAGLCLAKNLLQDDAAVAGIANKNVVLLTDGKPTYGIGRDAGTGSLTAICPGGSDMMGRGNGTTHAIHDQVENIAKSFASTINRYAVFVGNDTISCPDGDWRTCSLRRSAKPVSTWLREDCGFTTMSTTDADQLTRLFESVIQMIEIQAQAWILTDPMSKYVDVVNPEQVAGYNSETKEIVWDLKSAACDVRIDEDGNSTYVYNRSYRVRLNNLEPGFVAGQEYPTNGITSLTYTISQSDETAIPELQTAYFNIPSVKGFAGNVEFAKVDDFDQPLAGAGFTLKAKDGDFSMTASSGTDGKVSFGNIPSGHEYTLEETKVPEGYQKAGGKTISVAFGAVSGLGAGATIKNTSERTSVTVNKIWEDNDNEAGKRPDSIQVQLYANGKPYGDPVTISAPQPSTDEEAGTDQKVEEEQKPDAAQDPEADAPEPEDSEQPDAEQAESADEQQETDAAPADIDVDNVQEPAVTDDQSEPAVTEMQALSEEESEKVTEEAAEADPAPSIDPAPAKPTAVVNTWTYTWNNLPKYQNGEKIDYTVQEVNVPAGYAVQLGVATDGDTRYTIINTIEDTIDYTVTKTWHDDNNRDDLRPASIEVQLLANGSACGDPVELTAGGSWTHTWSDLPAFADGRKIEYTVDEVKVPAGYTKTITGSSIINTHTPQTINIPVTKVWDDNNNAAGKRPASVTADILKNGDEVVTTLTLTGEGDRPWTAMAKGLPWYENGVAIDYTVVERAVPYYTCNITENATKGFIITNTYKTPDIPVDPPYVPPYIPPYIPPVVPTPDPVDPQPLPPDDPLIEDPDKPIAGPQPLPPDEPLEDPGKNLPDDEYLQEADADKNPKQPKTGDESPLVPLAGLLLLSAGALGAIYIKSRKD